MGGGAWMVVGHELSPRTLALLGWSLGALAVGSVMVGLAIGMMLGERFERPLAQLADIARSYTFSRPDAAAFRLEGSELELAVADMVDRLRADHEDLRKRARVLVNNAERVAQLGSTERNLVTNQAEWSDEFHAIIGLVPGQVEISSELFLQYVHPGDRQQVADILVAVVASDIRLEADFRIIRPDGEIRVLHGTAEATRDERGAPIRLETTIQDITERKRMEDELDGLIRELWRSNEELEQFAYVASHDLRQPLRVVGSYVSLLEEELQGYLTGEAPEYMAFVRDGVRRMDRLITDLLAYSRVGRTSSEQPVPIDGALRAVIADLQFEIEDAGAVVQVMDGLPTVLGDQGEMERLFQNLLGNALKYRYPDVAPVITVQCEDGGDVWLISVIDNGIGIAPEHQERIFGIFQRLHARDEFEGTGVGLAIVKKILERHGGTIQVDPSRGAGEGTAMLLTWPKMGLAVGDG